MRNRALIHDRQELYEEACRLREEYTGMDGIYLRRLDAVIRLLSGTRTSELARETGVSTACLNMWVRRADEQGFDALKSETVAVGRPPKLSGPQFEEVRQLIERERETCPGKWNCTSLCEHLDETYGIQISQRTARRILYQLGIYRCP